MTKKLPKRYNADASTHVFRTLTHSLTVVSNMAAEGEGLGRKPDCIFCKIAAKEDETQLIYEDEEIAVFPDRKPAAKHHYLVVPKEHYGNPKSLHSETYKLVERLFEVGTKVLQDNQADLNDALCGYHWPPFNSIQHLHLHVISSRSQMGFFARQMHKPNSFWFVTHEWLLEHLKTKPSNSS